MTEYQSTAGIIKMTSSSLKSVSYANLGARLVGKGSLALPPMTLTDLVDGLAIAAQIPVVYNNMLAMKQVGVYIPMLLIATGYKESGLSNLFYSPANNPTEAYGVFMLINPTRRGLASQYGSDFLAPTNPYQVAGAIICYTQAYSSLINKRTPLTDYGGANIDNWLNNLRSVYGGGLKYRNHPDAVKGLKGFTNIYHTFLPQVKQALMSRPAAQTGDVVTDMMTDWGMPLSEFFTGGEFMQVKNMSSDKGKLLFMSSQMEEEYNGVPSNIKATVMAILDAMTGIDGFITSVNHDYTGKARDPKGNHNKFNAVDLALAPIGLTPDKLTSRYDASKRISPRYPFNPELWLLLDRLVKEGRIKCRVGLETDHIHLDNTINPEDVKKGRSVFIFPTARMGYANEHSACELTPRLVPLDKALATFFV